MGGGELLGCLLGLSVSWLVAWPVGQLVGWSVGWSVGRLVGWSVLVGWLHNVASFPFRHW